MNNRGRITVFLSLMVGIMLILAMTAISIIDKYMAKSKLAMCSRTAVSGVMAQYNSYIYEHYHILLFDTNQSGKGEGYIEESIIDNLNTNLGADYQVEAVAISEFTYLWSDDCEELKQQIKDYAGYAALEYTAELILDKTGGEDGTLAPEILQDIESAGAADTQADNSTAGAADTQPDDSTAGATGTQTDNSNTKSDTDDPRKLTGKLTGLGLLTVVLPDDIELSDRVLGVDEQTSRSMTGLFSFDFSLNNSFDSYSKFKDDISSHSVWKDSLIDVGVGVAYAAQVFNCATEQDVNDTSVLKCELEYLIGGKSSDAANIKSVVNRIIAIRLPVNYSFLMSDNVKSSELSTLATSLMAVTGIPSPILKRLLAGAWAYVEAVAEIRNLMAGSKLAFKKTASNWITDLDNLSESMYSTCEEDDKGLSYKDYLLILLAMDMDKGYIRMLDLIQLNTRETEADFNIKNAAVAISVDISVTHDGTKYGFKESVEY